MRRFTFDYTFDCSATGDRLGARGEGLSAGDHQVPAMLSQAAQSHLVQQEVYLALGSPMLDSVWSGYNVCLFA